MPVIHLKLPQLTPQQIKAIWDRLDKTHGQGPQGECWAWTGFRGDKGSGYGQFVVSYHPRRTCQASRLIYMISYGEDPGDKQVCHTCDWPPCGRPEHFFLGTSADNAHDMAIKGRAATGDRNGAHTHPESRAIGDNHWTRSHPEWVVRGERHGSTKVTDAQVKWVREMYALRDEKGKRCHSQTEVGLMVGLDQTQVSNIVLNKQHRV